MKIFSSKRRVVAAAIVAVLLVLFIWRPGASRLKSRIITSISAGVGRPVDIGSVQLRLLPRPGFDLENLVVYDDPAFGAEPILRAGEVSASLRLTSLLRGRMEIARLDLTEPSLNLVHSDSGRWNLEDLLERTAHIPLAPTGKAKSEPRPGFPYIEATSGRINFKSGAEKKPYTLTNADFSLWQDSENTWGVRLKAQPVRTDMNMTDTGQLQVNGTWQRAQSFRDTPMQFDLQWNRAQLGQMTKLLTGSDKRWRGEIATEVSLSGTPAKLKVSATGSLNDFRRYDITTGRALRLAANCDGEYSSVTHEFHEVLCSAPVGPGLITVTGDMGLPGSQRYALLIRAENIPASALLALAQRTKKDLPEDLEAEGVLHGNFSLQKNAVTTSKDRFEGQGELADFQLSSGTGKAEFGPETIPFSLEDSANESKQSAVRKKSAGLHGPTGRRLEIGPVAIGGGPAQIRGWMNGAGYNFSLTGETEVAKPLRLARMVGIPALPANGEGSAQLDLQIVGPWSGLNGETASGFVGPQVGGSARLRNVQVAARGMGSPAQIASADVLLLADKVRVSKLNAKVAGTNWTGLLEMPRGCGTACEIHFNLNAEQVALNEIVAWTNAAQKKQPWYRLLGPGAVKGPTIFASLHASGKLGADQVQIRGLTAKHVTADVTLEDGQLDLANVSADFLGGTFRGAWSVEFGTNAAVCKGSGDLAAISLSALSHSEDEPRLSGTANASFQVGGKCPAEFWTSAEGSLHFDIRDGVLPKLSLTETAEPLRVNRLTGTGALRAGKIEIKDARLDSADGKYDLNGSASLQRELDLRLVRSAGGGYAITGTLAEPQVASLSGPEQAHLKPLPSK